MDFKINGPKGPQKTDKAKKSSRSSNASGPSFADLLSETAGASETTSSGSIGGVGGVFNHLQGDAPDYVPQDPQEHGAFLLNQMEELEKDILTGTPTQAVERLKQALQHSPLEEANLTPKQREILDALHLRASIEIAKLEEGTE